MGIFINDLKASMGFKDSNIASKKRSIMSLSKKLHEREIKIRKELGGKSETKRRSELEEELQIIGLQIKKGERILVKLSP